MPLSLWTWKWTLGPAPWAVDATVALHGLPEASSKPFCHSCGSALLAFLRPCCQGFVLGAQAGPEKQSQWEASAMLGSCNNAEVRLGQASSMRCMP